jgi:nucleotide-binding universal stress UspA family protein
MNELVVGVDGSEGSRQALRWAASVAGAAQLPLEVVQAWSGNYPEPADEMDDRVRQDLARVAGDALPAETTNLDIKFEALRGPVVSALLDRVTADTGLVLGSRGRGGFAGLLLGSVSRECLEHSAGPVIIVRHDTPAPSPESAILVGHDGSPSAKRALEWAARLGQSIGAKIVVAYVWQASASEVRPRLHRRLTAAATRSVEGWAQAVGPDVGPVESEGEPRMELVNLAARVGAGLLVVGRRGKGTVRALRMGSVASYLVTSSPVPIAVVPPMPGTELS